jgi:hypothetical protein
MDAANYWAWIVDNFYAVMLIGGPIVFAIVLLWAMTHNRLSPRQKAQGDAAARRLYAEGAEDKGDGEPSRGAGGE